MSVAEDALLELLEVDHAVAVLVTLLHNYLQTTKGCEVHALSGEHWLMRLHPKFITDLIARRL